MTDKPRLAQKLSRIDLRISEEDSLVWRESAVAAKQTLSEWIRSTCEARVAAERRTRMQGLK